MIAVAAALAMATTENVDAFAPPAMLSRTTSAVPRFAEEPKASEAVFLPDSPSEETEEGDEDKLDVVEKLGRGSAKVRC